MSDKEEPPTKVSKLEDQDGVVESLDPEGEEDALEDGQEEWLSEGVLTDDDYNPGPEHETLDSSAADLGGGSQVSQDDTPSLDDRTPSLDDSLEHLDNNGQDWACPSEQNNPDIKHECHISEEAEKSQGTDSGVQGTADHTQGAESSIQENNGQTRGNDVPIPGVDSETRNGLKPGVRSEVQNIEETLTNFDAKTELPDDLDTFLIRKVKIDPGVQKTKQEDDGNDTDDLLRMLGDDDNKARKKVMVKKCVKTQRNGAASSDDDDDDEFIYEGAKVKTLKVAKNALMKKRPALRAEPEDMSEDFTDASSDEATTVKKMFGVTPKRSVASKSTAKPAVGVQPARPPAKQVAKVTSTPGRVQQPTTHSTPMKQYANKHTPSKSILKPVRSPVWTEMPAELKSTTVKSYGAQRLTRSKASPKPSVVKFETSKPPAAKSETSKPLAVKSETTKPPAVKSDTTKPSAVKLETSKSSAVKSETLKSLAVKSETSKPSAAISETLKPFRIECDEIIDEEEFLEDEEDFNLDEEEFADDSDLDEGTQKQRIMKPERMDEDVPTDGESHTEDGSLYDELPSSDSEDMDDWFTLDIRAERASDYLPLLGSKARELLLEEKRRVSARLSSLRQSASALTDSGRKQAEQLREATMSLAELDDMLKAT